MAASSETTPKSTEEFDSGTELSSANLFEPQKWLSSPSVAEMDGQVPTWAQKQSAETQKLGILKII